MSGIKAKLLSLLLEEEEVPQEESEEGEEGATKVATKAPPRKKVVAPQQFRDAVIETVDETIPTGLKSFQSQVAALTGVISDKAQLFRAAQAAVKGSGESVTRSELIDALNQCIAAVEESETEFGEHLDREIQGEVSEREERLQLLEEEIDSLEGTLDRRRQEKRAAEEEIEEAKKRVDDSRRHFAQAAKVVREDLEGQRDLVKTHLKEE